MPTALIVEDEPEANRLLARLVQLRGYRTESAFTGGDALATVGRGAPDVVFLDLMLPDVSGFEVCKALKTAKATALVPVVLVTARVAEDNRIAGFAHGADQFVSKPYTPDQIFEALSLAEHRVGDGGTAAELAPPGGDPGERLRQLLRFRSLLLARTPLDADAAGDLTDALRLLAEAAQSLGPASPAYAVGPDRVVLTLAAGGPAGGPPAGLWSEVAALGRFDEVTADPGGASVRFVKRFPAVGPAPTAPTPDREG